MAVPFYNSVTDKVAMERLGVSASDFEALVEDGHLLVSSLNTNKTFVCIASLEKYIKEFGGREARFRDKVDEKLFEASIKEISYIYREERSTANKNEKNLKDTENTILYDGIKNSCINYLKKIIEAKSEDVQMIGNKTFSDIVEIKELLELNQKSNHIRIPYSKDKIDKVNKFMEIIKLFKKNEKNFKRIT